MISQMLCKLKLDSLSSIPKHKPHKQGIKSSHDPMGLSSLLSRMYGMIQAGASKSTKLKCVASGIFDELLFMETEKVI